MKKPLIIFTSLISILALIAGYFYFLHIRPANTFIKNNKEAMVKTSGDFISCLSGPESQTCGSKYGSVELLKVVKPDQLEMLGKKMNSTLGKLGSYSIEEKSVRYNTIAFNGKGTTVIVSFVLKTQFEKDKSATVNITIVKNEDWPILISGFRINSAELLK